MSKNDTMCNIIFFFCDFRMSVHVTEMMIGKYFRRAVKYIYNQKKIMQISSNYTLQRFLKNTDFYLVLFIF